MPLAVVLKQRHQLLRKEDRAKRNAILFIIVMAMMKRMDN
jgi:hypothetical protein